MTIVPLHDQKRLVVQFENEFNRIVLNDSLSKGNQSNSCRAKALELIKEIKHIAKPRYFEDETLTFLEELSDNINSYVNKFLDTPISKAA